MQYFSIDVDKHIYPKIYRIYEYRSIHSYICKSVYSRSILGNPNFNHIPIDIDKSLQYFIQYRISKINDKNENILYRKNCLYIKICNDYNIKIDIHGFYFNNFKDANFILRKLRFAGIKFYLNNWR